MDIRNLFKIYKTFVRDGYQVCVPYLWYLRNKNLTEIELIKQADEEGKAFYYGG